MGPLAKNEFIFLFNQLILCRRVASQSLNLTVIQKAENLVSPRAISSPFYQIVLNINCKYVNQKKSSVPDFLFTVSVY